MPSDSAIRASGLLDKASCLISSDAELAYLTTDAIYHTIEQELQVINTHYSNLIEGHDVPIEMIHAAMSGQFSDDKNKRNLELESLAHVDAGYWIAKHAPSLSNLFSMQLIKRIHYEFYSRLPNSLLDIKDDEGHVVIKVEPGHWRSHGVKVGQHIPPPPEDIAIMMESFCQVYQLDRLSTPMKVIAIFCAHHRLCWIHPFADGNGRVIRLLTDATLKGAGIIGLWSLSRGLASSLSKYRYALAEADNAR